MYVLIVYSIGNACFKMIPTIANQFANSWIGGKKGFSSTMETNLDSISGKQQLEEATQSIPGLSGLFNR